MRATCTRDKPIGSATESASRSRSQHLVTDTLNRRADEYLSEVREAAQSEGTPLERLQLIVDAAAAYFSAHKNFRSLIRQVQGGAAILGPVLAAFADDVYGRYGQAMEMMTDLVREGQERGEIRAGNRRALAHLASVLTNEFVLADLPLHPGGIPGRLRRHPEGAPLRGLKLESRTAAEQAPAQTRRGIHHRDRFDGSPFQLQA